VADVHPVASVQFAVAVQWHQVKQIRAADDKVAHENESILDGLSKLATAARWLLFPIESAVNMVSPQIHRHATPPFALVHRLRI
jgi:hypothetical protein